jgi:transcriptional regulator NrdR family protein
MTPERLPKGLHCPECRGARLLVLSGYRPVAGSKFRYRECTACGCRVKTVEIVVKVVKSKKKSRIS